MRSALLLLFTALTACDQQTESSPILHPLSYSLYEDAVSVRTAGDYTYVCRGAAGLEILKTRKPEAPDRIATLDLVSGWCSDVKIAGTHAYIANWDQGLVIVDIRDPAQPFVKGSLPLTNASVVFIEGTQAYVAVENNEAGGGLAIVDVAKPSEPRLISFSESGGHGAGVSKTGNFVYLTHRDSGSFRGLKVYDVSQPQSPKLEHTLIRRSMEDIEIQGDHAYITAGNEGLEIFDLAKPDHPISLATLATSGHGLVLSVSVQESLAFITDYSFNKLYVIDISTKTAPKIIGTYATDAGALYLQVKEGTVAMTVEGSGLELIEVLPVL